MRDIQFNVEDVRKVAKALIEDAIEWDEGYTNWYNCHDGYRCNYCSASEYETTESLKHDLDCPVLVAQDLLT